MVLIPGNVKIFQLPRIMVLHQHFVFIREVLARLAGLEPVTYGLEVLFPTA